MHKDMLLFFIVVSLINTIQIFLFKSQHISGVSGFQEKYDINAEKMDIMLRLHNRLPHSGQNCKLLGLHNHITLTHIITALMRLILVMFYRLGCHLDRRIIETGSHIRVFFTLVGSISCICEHWRLRGFYLVW